MEIAAQETYSEVLHEVQEFINQFAQQASTRALNVETSTAKQIVEFKPTTPQFASFSETLAEQRSKQSDLLKLNGVELNSDSDQQAFHSLGIGSEDNLDTKEIEADFVAINENNNHNGNRMTSG